MKNINKLIIIILAVVIIVSWAGKINYEEQQTSKDTFAVIFKNGEVYQKIALPVVKDTEIMVTGDNGHYNLIMVTGHSVCVKEADCVNKICVKSGWLSKPGQMAVCVPNRLKVVIEGVSEEIDDISF